MKDFSRWSLLVLCALLGVVFVVADSQLARAQWKNAAPNLVTGAELGGAMQYRDGVIWAGGDNVWRSSDSGKTWQQSGNFSNASIDDIAFFDKLNGLISTQKQGLFHTSDGGNTWQNVITSGAFWKVSFNGSASVMHALDLSAIFYTSVDGGVTWTKKNIGNNIDCRSFAVANDGTIYVQASDETSNPYSGTLFYSKDLGGTWTPMFGRTNGDCYTLAVDSCDPKRLYLVNEEVYQPSDNIAKIYLSTDGGGSWAITDSHPRRFYSGSLATTNDALFAGTLDSTVGIYRSVDGSQTWKTIGGPALAPDSRNIAAINANMVLGMDVNGSIWLTTNGGGDSVGNISSYVGTVTLSTDSLFAGDTLHCDSLTLPVYIASTGCRPPLPVQYEITGRDSDSFHILSTSSDSVLVQWTSQKPGAQQAWLIALLADGTRDSVALAGFSTSTPLVYSIQSIFFRDTTYVNCKSVLEEVQFTANACIWPKVKSQRIVGADSLDYSLTTPVTSPIGGKNSATILFTPTDTGLRAATYELTLDNDTVLSIPLLDVGIAPHTLSLNAASLNEKTDTIGGTVAVPIIVDGLARTETIELILHYPLPDLDYVGSFDPLGTKVDIPGEQWPGRSKLRITGAIDSAIAAYARFNVFSDTAYTPQITFDSLNVPTALTPCEYLLPPAAIATIIPLQGCGIQMLSQWVHLGKTPVFGIRPNPTSGAISITCSMDVGDVSIEVYDMLGLKRGQYAETLGKDVPLPLSLSLQSGIYYVRIISQMGETNIPIIIEQ